ncbi:class I SAM-dependent methyltransferase [Larsenimonas rhizosphaerae]|uniref:class I SAM-dependent methyltransferase n=1 Tax=Larsenimonas rhizosphaerae TaxID=2944682 RepID=UPI0020340B12|nr:class I SAM-dependent methyltransferase [Larsenimonas rhizosphaerae]MCM2130318.1 class I SAM-dependent methyltransferase [Larsenimonas rhizosphaerae]
MTAAASPAPGSQFASDWLTLREPVDHRSRHPSLLAPLIDALNSQAHKRLAVVDLGCGRGSNCRYLAPRLPFDQHWQLIDHDPILLDEAMVSAPTLSSGQLELSSRLSSIAHPAELVPPSTTLVTASALLDLVSRPWLEALVAHCSSHCMVVMMTMSVDGRFFIEDPDGNPALKRLDMLMEEAINHHQQQERGLGTACGSEGWRIAAELLADAGYQVHCAPADWQLSRASGTGDLALAERLLSERVDAALEVVPASQHDALRAWLAARLEGVNQGKITINVGHQDVLAVPDQWHQAL